MSSAAALQMNIASVWDDHLFVSSVTTRQMNLASVWDVPLLPAKGVSMVRSVAVCGYGLMCNMPIMSQCLYASCCLYVTNGNPQCHTVRLCHMLCRPVHKVLYGSNAIPTLRLDLTV